MAEPRSNPCFTATVMIPFTRSAASRQASSLEFLAAYDERISL
jgi:hypothetical protein